MATEESILPPITEEQFEALNTAKGFATNATFTRAQAQQFAEVLAREGYVMVSRAQVKAFLSVAEKVLPPIFSTAKTFLRDAGLVE